jgi:uncharacterized protein YsxB (DUF464 family)
VFEVTFTRDSRNRLSSFFASGHVEIAENSSDEYSLVCAALSAVLQAARLGLEAYAGAAPHVEQRKGRMRLRVPEDARKDERVQAILATAELAAAQIAGQYPQHARVLRGVE